MEVRHKKGGCAEQMGCVFSLGLLPLMLAQQRKQMPISLTEAEMVLKNGTRIPWGNFTRMTATDVYLNRAFVRTQYALNHTNGKVMFGSDKIENSQEVIQFMLNHLPRNIVNPAK
jgi:hypothetical protein